MLTETTGPVPIEVPRDRDGSFEPEIVKKRQRRLTGVDEIVLSLYVKGLTTGEISAHFAEIYGASVSKETVSRITDKVVAEMQEWSSRPLGEVYVAIFIDAIVVNTGERETAGNTVTEIVPVVAAENRADMTMLLTSTRRADLPRSSTGLAAVVCADAGLSSIEVEERARRWLVPLLAARRGPAVSKHPGWPCGGSLFGARRLICGMLEGEYGLLQ